LSLPRGRYVATCSACVVFLWNILTFGGPQEYIRPGMRMLFRDGRVRGVGIITGIPGATAN
jgi:hypothetical protein